MKYIFKYVTIAALAISVIACDSIKSIEDKIDILESRIKAIESIIPSLNKNIEALKAFAAGGSISNVELVDGRYKFTMSNGDVIYLTQGSHGSAPTMSIDHQGYWMVDYHDGYGSGYVLCNGEKVSAVGNDGITPLFGVDKEGYWTVSYNNGNTWEQVKDAEGNAVTALPEGDSKIFSDISVSDNQVIVSLEDGTIFSIPIVLDFQFIINAPTDVVTLKEGEAKTFVISSRGVASASVVAVPDGFKAILTEDALIIQALLSTKVNADTSTDVAVLALSKDGHAAMGKVRVTKE